MHLVNDPAVSLLPSGQEIAQPYNGRELIQVTVRLLMRNDLDWGERMIVLQGSEAQTRKIICRSALHKKV